jgi:hypothetical protein
MTVEKGVRGVDPLLEPPAAHQDELSRQRETVGDRPRVGQCLREFQRIERKPDARGLAVHVGDVGRQQIDRFNPGVGVVAAEMVVQRLHDRFLQQELIATSPESHR